MKNTLTHILALLTIALVLAAGLMLTACSSTDCPLNNVVLQQIHFYDTSGKKQTVQDTLTITVRDSIVLNRATGLGNISLPMSYQAATDTLVFRYAATGATVSATDTVIISKTNTPHFVSLECSKVIYHNITDIKWSRRTPTPECRYAIDSIAVKNPEVNTDAKENLQIYFSVYQ